MTQILSMRQGAALVCGALVIAGAAHAATSGLVVITATVPVLCSIVVTPAAGASIADLTLGATNLKVASVAESCNAPDGYSVQITGSNSATYTGKFVDTVSGAVRTFNVSYNGASVNASKITDVSAPGSTTKDVNITYPADNTLTASSAATYRETLNFTITAK